MQPGFVPTAASFAVCVLLLLFLRHRDGGGSPLRKTLIALLGAVSIWTGGAALVDATARPELRIAGRQIMWAGVLLVPPLWLLLGARMARVFSPEVGDRPGWIALLFAPAALLYLAVLTNEGHHAFAVTLAAARTEDGPVYWMAHVWVYACIAIGLVFFLQRAVWLAGHREIARGAVLAVATVLPLAANLTRVTGLVEWPWDPTEAALGVSVLVMAPILLHGSFLDVLPLVRRDVIERLGQGVIVADPQGRIVDTNPAALRLLRRTESVRGCSLRAELDRLLDGPESAAKLLAAEAGPERAETWWLRDGRTLETRVVRVGSAARIGEPAGLFLVLDDRTREAKRERALRRAQRSESVGHLAAGLAHELNTPLAFVHANLAAISRTAALAARLGELGKPEERAALAELPEIVRESAEGVERMTRIVASLSRLTATGKPRLEEVDVLGCVREAMDLAGLSELPDATVDLAAPGPVPPVQGSRPALVQAFVQLLRNARQALGAGGGCVRIVVRATRGGVEVIVDDDGEGMPIEVQERIFDPFFTTRGPDAGAGLGLPIAYDVAREHHGELEVFSRPGHGSRFTLRLPRAPRAPGDASEAGEDA